MKTDREVFVVLKEVYLLLQLIRVSPIVISLEDCQVFSRAGLQDSDAEPILVKNANVMRREYGSDAIGILVRVLFDKCLRPVCRTIIGDVKPVCEIGFLGQNTFNCLSEVGPMIVGRHENIDQRCRYHGVLRVLDPCRPNQTTAPTDEVRKA